MDHIGIIKQAWRVTWRYKILWLFGLFAGGASGGGGSAGGNENLPWSGGTTTGRGMPGEELRHVTSWLQHNFATVLAVFFFLMAVGVVFFVLSIAAKGGLIHLVNEAEEGRPVRGLDGWTAGLRAWFRVFGIGFVLYVPYVILVVLILVAALAPVLRAVITGSEPGAEAFVGLCGGLAFGGMLLIVLGVLVGLLEALAVRHGVLDGSGVFASIGAAWSDVRVQFKDVIVVWLLLIGITMAFGIGVVLIAAMFALGIGAAVLAQSFVAAGLIGVVLVLVLLLPSAIFNTFTSAIWTVFFRRVTGRERAIADTPPSAPILSEQPYGNV
ncbi:MAG: hypothetical protein RBS78_06905 [Coriobacteriia bacterium]|jgi:hypothetical protein|nr:hypothetical protein [Coriobacteriia bacterium]